MSCRSFFAGSDVDRTTSLEVRSRADKLSPVDWVDILDAPIVPGIAVYSRPGDFPDEVRSGTTCLRLVALLLSNDAHYVSFMKLEQCTALPERYGWYFFDSAKSEQHNRMTSRDYRTHPFPEMASYDVVKCVYQCYHEAV